MKLYFLAGEAEHTVDVLATMWDENTRCIALIYDEVMDQRTPHLTPNEARELARRLTIAAEEAERV
ncbi:hypothetical protein [Pimelobacter simplex]|uniref:hypothetical protein n=1 Tax=Nocardioides simplex TaxID=2045 RepID=UPI0019342358|nr:hypothetical protein [Pimelobacter simplex]